MMNKMPIVLFSFRYKVVLNCTSAAENAALHYGTQNGNQWVLKMLSYLVPYDSSITWPHVPPQAVDGCPILTEQDNRGNICFAFNPVSQGKLTNQLLSQTIIRESIELRRLLPFKVDGGDMVSNVMTKNETPDTYQKQTQALIGNVIWPSLLKLKDTYKPVWCKYCSCSDTTTNWDSDEKCYIAVCNICGAMNY